jgi:cell division protein FtsQ
MHDYNNREYNYPETPFYDYNSVENGMVNSAERFAKDNRLKDRRERTARAFKIIIAVLVFVIFIQVIYHLYFARNVIIDRIVIETGAGFSATDDQILKMAGIGSSESFFALDLEQVKIRLLRYPQIADVEVDKKFPDTLNLKIEGRVPLAVCLIESNGRVIPSAVDSNGVIFQIGKSVSDLNLPVVSGIKISEARMGVVMPAPVLGFLNSLEELRKDSPAFFNSISEFQIIRKSNDDFEVLMYPQNYSIPVRVGNRISKDLFTYIILVLDVARQQGLSDSLQELDFRTDEVVYRIREE